MTINDFMLQSSYGTIFYCSMITASSGANCNFFTLSEKKHLSVLSGKTLNLIETCNKKVSNAYPTCMKEYQLNKITLGLRRVKAFFNLLSKISNKMWLT